MTSLRRTCWSFFLGAGLLVLPCALVGCDGAVDQTPPGGGAPAVALPARGARPADTTAPLPDDLDRFAPETVEQFRAAVAAVDASPRNPDRWRKLGMTYQANFEYQHAATAYAEAVSIDASDARAWYYLAVALNELGELEEALAAIDHASSLAPDFAPAEWRRALWHLGDGAFDQAMAAVERSLERAPDDATARTIRARIVLQSGRAEEAAELLEQLLEDRPQDPFLHFLLGTAYRQMGRLDDASAELERGDGKEPTWPDPWLAGMSSRRQGFFAKYDEARKMIDAGRPGPAVAALEKLRESHADEMMILIDLARCYRMLGDLDAAASTLDQAFDLDPEDARVAIQQAGVECDLAQAAPPERRGELLARALASANRACELNPDLALAETLRADILLLMGRIDDAIAGHQRAIALNPGNATAAFRLGASLYTAERWDEAIEQLERAARLDPNRAEVVLLLAVAQLRTGDVDAARRTTVEGGERFPLDARFAALLRQIDG